MGAPAGSVFHASRRGSRIGTVASWSACDGPACSCRSCWSPGASPRWRPPAGRSGAPTDAISVAGLERRLRFIASDALEGRESLSPGFRAAAEYLASELTGLGLTPRGDDGSFLQRVTMRRTSVDPAGDLGRGLRADLRVWRRPARQRRRVGHGPRRLRRPRIPHPVEGHRPVCRRRRQGRAAARCCQARRPGVTYRDLQALTKGTDWWGPEDNARALGARA